MTEAEWSACTNAHELLAVVWGRADERSRRLFIVACCRRIDDLLVDERSRRAVEVASRRAEGRATEREMAAASAGADAVVAECRAEYASLAEEIEILAAASARCVEAAKTSEEAAMELYLREYRPSVRLATWERRLAVARAAAASLAWDLGEAAHDAGRRMEVEAVGSDLLANRADDCDWCAVWASMAAAEAAERRAHCDILRDLFGDRPSPPAADLGPAWMSWNEGFIPQFAEAVYETEEFENLPVLADALEAAGCSDAAILGHLRRPEPHWRGCWALGRLIAPRPLAPDPWPF